MVNKLVNRDGQREDMGSKRERERNGYGECDTNTHTQLLTRIPSHLETARRGRKALNVLMERKAGISAAPNQIAPKFINDSYKLYVIV